MNTKSQKAISFTGRTEDQLRRSFSLIRTKYRNIKIHTQLKNGLRDGYILINQVE